MSYIVNRRGLAGLGITGLIIAAALLAWQAGDSGTVSAGGAGQGMSLTVIGGDCAGDVCSVEPGGPFTVAVVANAAPGVDIAGFDTEVYFGGLEWLPRPACSDELQVGRQDGQPVGQCVVATGPNGEARHVAISEVNVPPLAALEVATGDTLIELDSVCADSGTYAVVLTAVTNGPDDAPFGAAYFDTLTNQLLVTPVGITDIGGTTVAVAADIDISCDLPVEAPTQTPGLSAAPTIVESGSGGTSGGDSSSPLVLLAVAGVLLAATVSGFGLHRWRSGNQA